MRLMILMIVLFAAVTIASSATLTQGERDRAMSYLHASRKQFLDETANLSDAQWNFKPGPDRWSIAECAEHIVLTEEALFGMVQKILKSPAVPGTNLSSNDEAIMKMITNRTQKAKAPEQLRPTHRWKSREELIAHFKELRDSHIAFIRDTQEDMRVHVSPHPVFKQLDAYQWILYMAGHSERHTEQIREVKADPNYPKQ